MICIKDLLEPLATPSKGLARGLVEPLKPCFEIRGARHA